jgi:3',5'-cyclic AMP phosphodiesterase CpdA
VAIHQPFYSTAKDRDNLNLRKLYIPIFDKYSVDLVLQGHDHTYGRTYKMRNGIKVDDGEKGTVYVVSVSGPKIYSINQKSKDLMVKMGTGRQLFQVIGIDQNRLTYESYTATGELYDSFELEKVR